MKIIDYFNHDQKQKKYTYIIAEVAQAHDGSLGIAHSFIDAIASTGVDAIKFQTHFADEESTPSEKFRVNFSYEDNTRFDYWKRMEFSENQWRGLMKHSSEVGLEFLSSVFSDKAFDMMHHLGLQAWKFGSGEFFNTILLNKAIESKKPIILSTGMSKIIEIDEKLEYLIVNNSKFSMLQTTTMYPTPLNLIGLNIFDHFKSKNISNFGLSDHSGLITPSIVATSLGATMVEVHATFDKQMFGPDSSSSLDIKELKELVKQIRNVDCILNSKVSKDSIVENLKETKKIFTKGLYLKTDLNVGDEIKLENLIAKKPSMGISVDNVNDVIGKSVNKDLNKGDLLKWEDIL